MASPPAFTSTKETTNFARLCRLLVDGGSQALRLTFDKIHPPAGLHKALLSPSSVHTKLQSLYKGKKKVLNPTQWKKLYPAHGSVSSAGFDITLLTVLLRNICGLSTPAAGWDNLPAATDTNTEDDIARVKYYRNNLYGHASQASIDDVSFNDLWHEIREALVRLGGANFGVRIDSLKTDSIDPDTEEYYRKLLEQWKKDDDSIKEKMEKMEEMEGKIEQWVSELQGTLMPMMKEIKEIKNILTAPSDEDKDKEKIRDDLEQMKSEMETLSDKLKTLKTSTPETKEQDPFSDVEQMKLEILKGIKENLESLSKATSGMKDEDPFDPAELIDGIRQLYKARKGMLSPFPWCEEFQFHLNDIYTRLKIVSRKKTRRTETDEIIQMHDIFSPHDELPQPRVVLIEGDLGMGKTTYCNKLAYDWATENKETEDCLARFQVVLLLKCRDIRSDLWEAIDDQLLPRDVEKEEKEMFFQFIRHNQSKVLLVLDGWDELPASCKLPELEEIIGRRMLPKSHVVVTSRREGGRVVKILCDTLLEITGFTEEDARTFIVKYFKTMEDLAQKLLHKLGQDQHLKKMSLNPLSAALLCLLCEDFHGIFPHNRTELYLEFVQCVLRRYRIKKGLPVTNEDLIKVHKDELHHLGLIALNGLRVDNMYFEDTAFGIHSGISGFGFLSVQPESSKRRPCVYYGFQHKSFQELFAGFYLCCQLIAKEISPESLVSYRRYFGDLKQVLLFTCGILATQCEETAVALIKSITAEVNKGHDDYFLVALECINECKKEHGDLHMTLAEVLGSCLQCESVVVGESRIDNAGATLIAEFLKYNFKSTLKKLILINGRIRDPGCAVLAEALQTNKTLETLDLSGCNIGNAGAAAIAEMLKHNTTLKKVGLCENIIGGTGVSAIAEALKVNTILSHLDLASNTIHCDDNDDDDSAAAAVVDALNVNETLECLEVSFHGSSAFCLELFSKHDHRVKNILTVKSSPNSHLCSPVRPEISGRAVRRLLPLL